MRDVLTTVLELVGLAAIAVGVVLLGFVFLPGALIVGGAGLILMSKGLSR